jgi:hypothetical protein
MVRGMDSFSPTSDSFYRLRRSRHRYLISYRRRGYVFVLDFGMVEEHNLPKKPGLPEEEMCSRDGSIWVRTLNQTVRFSIPGFTILPQQFCN